MPRAQAWDSLATQGSFPSRAETVKGWNFSFLDQSSITMGLLLHARSPEQCRGQGRQNVATLSPSCPMDVPPLVPSPVWLCLLRTSLLPNPLLKDTAGSVCSKEGLLPPRCCRQNWRSALTTLHPETPHTLSFVCPFLCSCCCLCAKCGAVSLLSNHPSSIRHPAQTPCSWPAFPRHGVCPSPGHPLQVVSC